MFYYAFRLAQNENVFINESLRLNENVISEISQKGVNKSFNALNNLNH